MGRRKKRFNRVTSYKYGKFIKSQGKWFLGILLFVSVIVFVATPWYLWGPTLNWLSQFPPIYIFDMLIPAFLFMIAMAIILRGIYCIIKNKPFIPTR